MPLLMFPSPLMQTDADSPSMLVRDLFLPSDNRIDHFFFTYETEFVLFLAVLDNSVLPMGLDSSHATLKVTSVVYKRSFRTVTKTPNDIMSRPSYNVIVNILFKLRFFK